MGGAREGEAGGLRVQGWAQACNPSTQEIYEFQAAWSIEFQNGQGYTENPCLEKPKQQQKQKRIPNSGIKSCQVFKIFVIKDRDQTVY